jgi:predicted peroxiredoxin
MSSPEKFVIIVTHGPEHPEMATIPFVMAAAAIVSDVEVCLVFQGDGVNLIRKGGAAHVFAHSFPPLADLMQSVVELGGQLMACTPCLDSRELKAPDDLEPGVEVIGAARLVAEIASATSTLTY